MRKKSFRNQHVVCCYLHVSHDEIPRLTFLHHEQKMKEQEVEGLLFWDYHNLITLYCSSLYYSEKKREKKTFYRFWRMFFRHWYKWKTHEKNTNFLHVRAKQKKKKKNLNKRFLCLLSLSNASWIVNSDITKTLRWSRDGFLSNKLSISLVVVNSK